MKKSCGIEDWMWQDGEIVWEKINNQLVKATPLYKHFHKLTRQCETLMTGASQIFEDGAGEDIEMMIKTTSLCGDIIAAWGDIERAMKVMGKDPTSVSDTATANAIDSDTSIKNKGKGVDPLIEMDRKYAQECERLAFAYVSLSEPMPLNQGLNFPNFKYSSSLTQTSSATRNPKDRLHLVKELAVMATSLPAGIWVRLDEVRNDAMSVFPVLCTSSFTNQSPTSSKVMIAGPEGTPYAGGLFEFDCFIPLEYPHKPPLMHLRTTGGGSVRFNPNLYNCGKVCLSLLGTWPGR